LALLLLLLFSIIFLLERKIAIGGGPISDYIITFLGYWHKITQFITLITHIHTK
jgi:hypothetical protein